MRVRNASLLLCMTIAQSHHITFHSCRTYTTLIDITVNSSDEGELSDDVLNAPVTLSSSAAALV